MLNKPPKTPQQIWLRVLLIFLIWRCSLFLLEFLGLQLTEEFDFFGRYLNVEGIINARKEWQAFPSNYFFDGFFRFDSVWFDRIAQRGYYIEGSQSNVAFFPLYPYLSRWLGYLIGNHLVAGWIISNLSLIGSLFYIYRIGLLYFNTRTIERAFVLLLVFPNSFYLSTFYSEGLFLLTTTASFYAFLTQKYLKAGIWGMLACLTRFSGILLFFAFVADLLYSRWRAKQPFQPAVAFLLLIPVGILIFMLILTIQVGDPLAFMKAQAGWGRERTFPLITLAQEFTKINFQFPRDPNNAIHVLDWLGAVGFLLISVLMALKRYRVSLWSYTAFSILMPLSTGTTMSMLRFCSVTFPAFFYLAEVARRSTVYAYLLFVFAFLLSIYNLRFMNWFYGV